MKISVIIPTHNRSDALRQTLEKLKLQKLDEKWEAIVINNNSTDDTDEAVFEAQKDFPVNLKLVREKKKGAAAARNAGAGVAEGEFLVFIDNDILTAPDFLQRHLNALRQNQNAWIVGQIMNLPEQENSAFGQFRKSLSAEDNSPNIREVSGITGANSSLPRVDFKKLGGFDENFHVASGEDQELLLRARKQLGVKALLVPDILVVHNDWAGWTFEDFCLRQQIYARTEFFFWQKYGDEHPRQQLVKENLPLDWRRDSYKLLFRKKVKQLLSEKVSQTALLKTCALLEKSPALRPVLWRFYKLTLAGAIHKGFNEGRTHFLKDKV